MTCTISQRQFHSTITELRFTFTVCGVLKPYIGSILISVSLINISLIQFALIELTVDSNILTRSKKKNTNKYKREKI